MSSSLEVILKLRPHGKTSLEALKSINELSLGCNRLTSLPESIGQLTNLRLLNLYNNQLSSLPESIGQLTNLTYLGLDENQLSLLPKSIGQLTKLEYLALFNNPITELPESITYLKNLKELQIEKEGKMKIQRAPFGITALPCYSNNEKPYSEMKISFSEALKKLKLYKYDNENLIDIRSLIGKWKACDRINISNNRISTLPDQLSTLTELCDFNISYNMFATFPDVLLKMSWLTSLNIAYNSIFIIPEAISILTELSKFNASGNQSLTQIPPTLMSVTSLVVLDMSFNKISEIPNTIQELHKLAELNIENNQIKKLPLALGCMENLKVIKYDGNPIQDPPRNILNRGSDAVINYLQTLNQGTVKWTQGRILLLGEGKVGKSTLVKAITQKYTFKFDSVCDENRDRTDGIARIDLDETSFGGFFQTKLKVKVWDFGGQDDFQVTHPFFLSSGSLVIILYSLSQNATENKLDRWIQLLDDFAPGSSVLIVGTHRDKRNKAHRQEMTREIEKLQRANTKQHKYLATDIQVSSFNGKGINDLKAKIYESLMSLENVNLDIPKQYVRLKEYFEDKAKTTKTMKLEEVQSFSQSSLKMNESQLTTALNFLHDLGSILWYSGQPHLRGIVFLDPLFMIDIFKSVFSFKGISKHQGGLILKTELKKKIKESSHSDLSEETFEVICETFHFFGLSIPYSDHTIAFPILMEARNLEKHWKLTPESDCFAQIEFSLESESSIQKSHRAQILSTTLKLGHDESDGFLPRNTFSKDFCIVFFDYHPQTDSFKSGTGFKILVHLQEKTIRVVIRNYSYSGDLNIVAQKFVKQLEAINQNIFQKVKIECPECKVLKSNGFLVASPSLESNPEAWTLCHSYHNVSITSLLSGTILRSKENQPSQPPVDVPNTASEKPTLVDERIDFANFDNKLASLKIKDTIECHASCGKGTFGEVFKAHFKGREVAVKKQKIKDQDSLEEIINEIIVTHKCQCDYVAKVYGVQRTNREVSIIMELATTSLDKRAEEGSFINEEIVHFASNIASGLKFIFSQSIFHHDLKAQNVLIVGRTAKLCDFGLANQRQRLEIASYLASRDGGGMLSGTINWQGPEIYNKTFHSENDDSDLDNTGHRGEASDVYAFGLLVWYLVAREEPFAGNSPANISVLVRNGSRPAIPHDTHVVLKRIIRTCWSQHYKLRPKIGHVLDVLAECKEGNLDAASPLLDSALPIQTRLVKEMSPGEVVEIARDRGVSPEGIEKLVNSGAFLGSLVAMLNEKSLTDAPYQLSKNDAVLILGLCERSKELAPEDKILAVDSSAGERPPPPKPIVDMNTDQLVAYLRGQKGILDYFLDIIRQEGTTGDEFLALSEQDLVSEPFKLTDYNAKRALKAIQAIRLLSSNS